MNNKRRDKKQKQTLNYRLKRNNRWRWTRGEVFGGETVERVGRATVVWI